MAKDPRFVPVGIKAPHGAREIEIRWADGQTFALSHVLFRGYCPCAGCQGHGGPTHFIEGADLEILELEQVGTYALTPTWGDRHSTGIYSYRYLRALCELDPNERRDLVEGRPQGDSS
jgi:DUF971 family protein